MHTKFTVEFPRGIQRICKRLLDFLTTIHFLFCSSSFGGFLAATVAPYLGVVVVEEDLTLALTTEDPRSAGFLWVFMSSVTFFRPAGADMGQIFVVNQKHFNTLKPLLNT